MEATMPATKISGSMTANMVDSVVLGTVLLPQRFALSLPGTNQKMKFTNGMMSNTLSQPLMLKS